MSQLTANQCTVGIQDTLGGSADGYKYCCHAFSKDCNKHSYIIIDATGTNKDIKYTVGRVTPINTQKDYT